MIYSRILDAEAKELAEEYLRSNKNFDKESLQKRQAYFEKNEGKN